MIPRGQALVLVVLSASCMPSLDRARPFDGLTDGAVRAETAPTDTGPVDTVPPVSTITCDNDCRDMVVSRVLLPTVSTKVKAIDLDGDGAPDNALGTILLALNAAVPSLNLQDDLDAAVSSGNTLMLIRAQAASFVDAQRALAQMWQAERQICCTSIEDVAACRGQADQTCFAGHHTFRPDPVTPNGSVLGGQIKSGHAAYGPAHVALALPLTPKVTLQVEMIGGRLQGDLTSKGISNGLLGGAIPKIQLETEVIPAIAKLLNNELADPNSAPSTRDAIKTMFDADGNGSISTSEVKGNGLVKTFLNGDVDVDGDHVNELSVGLEFEAVQAVIDAGSGLSD